MTYKVVSFAGYYALCHSFIIRKSHDTANILRTIFCPRCGGNAAGEFVLYSFTAKNILLTLRFDDDMKIELYQMVDEMGMNLTTFFMIYAKRALRDRRIPFEITAPIDPFYSESNKARLRESEQQFLEGRTVTKTMEELEAMASE